MEWESTGDNVRLCRDKRVKGLLLVGCEEVPCGFRLRTRDCSGTADGAGNCGRPSQLSMGYWEEWGI